MDRKWPENLVGRGKHESAGAGMKNRVRVFYAFQGMGRVVRSCGSKIRWKRQTQPEEGIGERILNA